MSPMSDHRDTFAAPPGTPLEYDEMEKITMISGDVILDDFILYRPEKGSDRGPTCSLEMFDYDRLTLGNLKTAVKASRDELVDTVQMYGVIVGVGPVVISALARYEINVDDEVNWWVPQSHTGRM
jgi:hypothetical protein